MSSHSWFVSRSISTSIKMRLLALIVITVTLLEFACSDEESPTVKTSLGTIKGYYKVSSEGRQYKAFEGVPYALPPVGERRFKPPEPVTPWPGELTATRYEATCLQYTHFPANPPEKIEGAEDCLYLNVYVPVKRKRASAELLPVIFWIHGGAFQYGSGIIYNVKFLMNRDVIFVTINYRLGPLGFLSTEDATVPGNMGLKDQNMALQWVKQNIKSFGGDPDRVTLIGLSAGGASVHYHYLSPLSANLFQGGISMSGTALDCWTQTENSREKAKQLAAIVGCPTTDIREMVNCLRTRPANAIVQAVSNFQPWLYNPYTPFGPVVEKTGDKPFLHQSPIEIMNNGKIYDAPWITGDVSEEGLYPAAEFIDNEVLLKELNDKWESIAPHLLDFNNTIPREKHAEVANQIRTHYMGTKSIDKMNIKPLIQMIGDRLYNADAERAAKLQAKKTQNPVWFYYFSYRGAHSYSDSMSRTNKNFGVSHADDAYYVLETAFMNATTTPEDRAMQVELINFWVSFATDNVPNVDAQWDNIDPSKENLRYLHIAGPGNNNMESNHNFGQRHFWDKIKFTENKLSHSSIVKNNV